MSLRRNKMKEVGLKDVEPIKLVPTWRNMRKWDTRVEKRLHTFKVLESIMFNHDRIRSWVEVGGESNHLPILLHIVREDINLQVLLNSTPHG
jgi:hypothetical protein